jgi:hypothetical protein
MIGFTRQMQQESFGKEKAKSCQNIKICRAL